MAAEATRDITEAAEVGLAEVTMTDGRDKEPTGGRTAGMSTRDTGRTMTAV